MQTLPATLLEATNELKQCHVMRDALGKGRDEDIVDWYVAIKRREWDRYHEQVSPWEVNEYLNLM